MKFVRDSKKGLGQRPYFQLGELDLECEQIVTDFMSDVDGQIKYPISTDTLTKLLERDTSDLDLYADLAADGSDVEGVTDFFSGKKPRVRISKHLSEQRSENRLRTTLTHEYGHVRFHAPLFASTSKLILPQNETPKCKRENILTAAESDWMEWQAGYVCGAMLMPVSEVRKLAKAYCAAENLDIPISISSKHALPIIYEVSSRFSVSEDAARVRLTKLTLLTKERQHPTLF